MRKEKLYPRNWTEDIYFERAASNEPYHKVLYETEYRTVFLPVEVTEVSPVLPESTASEGQAGSLDGNGDWPALRLSLALVAVVAGLVLVRRLWLRKKPSKEP